MLKNVLWGVVVSCAFAACANDVAVPTESGAFAVATVEPEGLPYPEGPFGVTTGSLIQNLVINGYVDDDGDTHAYNDQPREFALAEYFAGTDSAAKVIMLDISVSWCGPCQQEATHLRAAHETYNSQGARIYTVMLDDLPTTKTWAKKYDLPFPVLADADATTEAYLNATPLNMFIDASNMKILKKVYGGDFESTLQYYLNTL